MKYVMTCCMQAISLPFGRTYCFSTTNTKGTGQSETTVTTQLQTQTNLLHSQHCNNPNFTCRLMHETPCVNNDRANTLDGAPRDLPCGLFPLMRNCVSRNNLFNCLPHFYPYECYSEHCIIFDTNDVQGSRLPSRLQQTLFLKRIYPTQIR